MARTAEDSSRATTVPSLALAMVKPDFARLGSELKIKILGEMFPATVIAESPYDADNARLRA